MFINLSCLTYNGKILISITTGIWHIFVIFHLCNLKFSWMNLWFSWFNTLSTMNIIDLVFIRPLEKLKNQMELTLRANINIYNSFLSNQFVVLVKHVVNNNNRMLTIQHSWILITVQTLKWKELALSLWQTCLSHF